MAKGNDTYLEDNEPISVFMLSDLVDVIEDIGRVISDVARIQRKRPDDFKQLAEMLKSKDQENLTKILPEDVGKQVFSSFFGLMAKFAYLGEKSKNPEDLKPEELEEIGKALIEEAKKIDKIIQIYEKSLISNKNKK